MTRRYAARGCPVAVVMLAVLVGCGTPRSPAEEATATTSTTSCAACHGDRSADVLPGDPHAAPGFNGGTDVKGQTNALTAASIGAHDVHLSGGFLGVAVSCDQCHVVPETLDDPGHMDGQVEVSFGKLASKGGLKPAYDPATQTCSNTYCHGGTPGWKSTPVVPPKWSQGSEAIVCGSCHGLPPPSPVHLQIQPSQGCGTSVNPTFQCHPAGYSQYTVDPKLHMDGQICPPDCTPVSP